MGVSLSLPRLNLTHDQSNCVCLTHARFSEEHYKGKKSLSLFECCHLLADENEQSVENMIEPFVVFR